MNFLLLFIAWFYLCAMVCVQIKNLLANSKCDRKLKTGLTLKKL